ncbi:lysophosphatidic acid phosphatase type 6-like [Saccostrea cucullata]|uniref:lysophosphatidic acid phosphatase type 6-like n=1 Tax=Saccostrea cuccullata TaxID=36930 RepID=UPI002ED1EC5D
MSSSRKKLVLVALGGLAGVTGAWTYFRQRDDTDRHPRKKKVEDIDLSLKQVQVIFRHGARTPLHLIPGIEEATYDKKKWKKPFPPTVYDYEVLNIDGKEAPDSKYEEYYKKLGLLKGGCPHGMLTYLGQVQTYNLGRRLRKCYMGKLPGRLMSEFDPDLVYLRTTNMNRTKDSLRCVLAGIFGAEQLQEYSEKNGKKVTFYTSEQEDEHLFPNPHTCPVLKRINRAAIVDGVDLPEFLEERLEIEKVLGLKGNDWKHKIHFISARDDLVARSAHGLPIPKVLVPYVTKITENAVQLFTYSFIGQHELQNDIASNLSSGRMLEQFRNAIRDFVIEKRPVRLFLYSAHDSSLMALLLALKLDDKHWPPFASDLLFELHQCNNSKEYYVIVRYNGEAVVLPKLKKRYVEIGQESAVPLKYFMRYLNEEKVMEAREYRKVCESNILDIIAEEIEKREGLKIEDTEAEEMTDRPAGM